MRDRKRKRREKRGGWGGRGKGGLMGVGKVRTWGRIRARTGVGRGGDRGRPGLREGCEGGCTCADRSPLLPPPLPQPPFWVPRWCVARITVGDTLLVALHAVDVRTVLGPTWLIWESYIHTSFSATEISDVWEKKSGTAGRLSPTCLAGTLTGCDECWEKYGILNGYLMRLLDLYKPTVICVENVCGMNCRNNLIVMEVMICLTLCKFDKGYLLRVEPPARFWYLQA